MRPKRTKEGMAPSGWLAIFRRRTARLASRIRRYERFERIRSPAANERLTARLSDARSLDVTAAGDRVMAIGGSRASPMTLHCCPTPVGHGEVPWLSMGSSVPSSTEPVPPSPSGCYLRKAVVAYDGESEAGKPNAPALVQSRPM